MYFERELIRDKIENRLVQTLDREVWEKSDSQTFLLNDISAALWSIRDVLDERKTAPTLPFETILDCYGEEVPMDREKEYKRILEILADYWLEQPDEEDVEITMRFQKHGMTQEKRIVWKHG